jgi:hypothetical protein
VSLVVILVMAVVSGGDAIFGELPFTVSSRYCAGPRVCALGEDAGAAARCGLPPISLR